MKYLTKVPFIRIWANLFIFKGKETFKQYLLDFLIYLSFAIGIMVCLIIYFNQDWHDSNLVLLIYFAMYYVLVPPLLSMTARRFYTIGSLWKFCFIIFIPLGGVVWTTIACLASRSEEEAEGRSHKKRVKSPMLIATIASPSSLFGAMIVLIIVAFIVDIFAPPTVKNKVEDYQFIFGIADTFKRGERDIISFGEYKYNSYLLLVPRETPSTLEKFYYRWMSGAFDVDDYGFYFECKLEQDKFDNYVDGLANFSVKVGNTTKKLVKTEDAFDYPTYVVQWWNVGPKWQVFEYIMLDEVENKVVYAFSMSTGYDQIVKNASYNIAPHNGVDIVPREMDGFSIYRDSENDEVYKLDEMVYDTSFLNNLL